MVQQTKLSREGVHCGCMISDTEQVALVKDSRRVASRGFSHSGMAGDLRNNLLQDTLSQTIPELSFHNGLVNRGDGRSEWNQEDLSSECDIIVHSGTPWEQMQDCVIVPQRDAHSIIEVKSWISAKDFPDAESDINAQINQLQSEIDAPVFLCAFRHSTDRERLEDNSVADETFVFASGAKDKTEEIVYRGVLQELIEAIKANLKY